MKSTHQLTIVLTAFFMTTFFSFAQEESSEFSLIGIWQDAPYIASGWSQNYQFFGDGRFNFNHNQMDCADSILTESGTYHYEEGMLYLDYDSVTYISGGELIPSTGSCGSDFELVGGEVTSEFREKSEGIIIEEVEPLEDYDYLTRIRMDDQEWFRMMHDPNDY